MRPTRFLSPFQKKGIANRRPPLSFIARARCPIYKIFPAGPALDGFDFWRLDSSWRFPKYIPNYRTRLALVQPERDGRNDQADSVRNPQMRPRRRIRHPLPARLACSTPSALHSHHRVELETRAPGRFNFRPLRGDRRVSPIIRYFAGGLTLGRLARHCGSRRSHFFALENRPEV